MSNLPSPFAGAVFAAFASVGAGAQVEVVSFAADAPGVSKSISSWGLDTAWLSSDNVRRGAEFMGRPQVDIIRFSFTGDWPLDNGSLSTAALAEFSERMAIVNSFAGQHAALYLNNDTGVLDPYFQGNRGVEPYRWARLIDETRRLCVAAGRTVLSVAPLNEPDYSTWQGDVVRFGDVCWQIRNTFGANFQGIALCGPNTLSNDAARGWYDSLNGWGFADQGNTHQLSGSFDNYAGFYEHVEAQGDIGVNDELHNVAEAMIGAEYGMDVGIWWGTAERARGEFVKASDGVRLGYAENRPNWTAASVYRAPSGAVKAFVGESERQAVPTTYRFVSKDRPVFFDGHGPTRIHDVRTTGDPNRRYWTSNHKNAERVVDITWGDDVQPAIDGRYYLVNRNSRKVLEVAGGGGSDGSNVQQNAYRGALHQQWDVTPLPYDQGGDTSYFSITAAHSGGALDVDSTFPNRGLEDGDNVFHWSNGVGVNQQWFFEYAGDGWFHVRNRWSGKFLDVYGASTQNGGDVRQWAGNGQVNQQWRLVPAQADPRDFTRPAGPVGLTATPHAVSVRLDWTANSESDLGGYEVLRAPTASGPFEILARGLTVTSFLDRSANRGVTYHYVVRAVDLSLNRSAASTIVSIRPTAARGPVALYQFRTGAGDHSINENHGSLEGSARLGIGQAGSACLSLDGSVGYVALPAEVADHDELTISAWVFWDGGAAWQRVFDFGNGDTESLYLTPANGGSRVIEFTMFDTNGTHRLFGPRMPIRRWTHLAVTLGSAAARLYVDGKEVDSSAGFGVRPSDIRPVLNYLGKSQFDSDPWFDGSIDDVYVHNYAMSAGQVAILAARPTWVAPR